MSNTSKFFSDPKVAISILALLIAMASFVWTIFSNWDHNRRWDSLNLGTVEISDIGFIMWKELTKDEAINIDWGYKPSLFSHTENRVHTGKYRIPYELILVDPGSQKRIDNSNGFFTISEGVNEIKRVNIDINPEIRKHYQIQFNFMNMGQTIANDIQLNIRMEHFKRDTLINAFTSNSIISLLPTASSNAIVDFYTPLNLKLPAEINFEIEIKYNDINNNNVSLNRSAGHF